MLLNDRLIDLVIIYDPIPNTRYVELLIKYVIIERNQNQSTTNHRAWRIR